ncbi:uncharacterized protein LOC144629654 [Oculina patagonica]
MSQNRNPQETVFVDFIREGKLAEVRRILLENGHSEKSNPLLKKKFGQFKETALHLAVKYGHEGIVKLLLRTGADIHATDIHKCTVLHTAADQNEGIDIITLILKCNGVDANALDGFGNTPIKLAAEKGNSDAVRLLMENGAEVTIADKGENTTLHVAAKKGHIQVLEMLLIKVANTGIIGKQNKDKKTPLHLAVESKSQHCVAMLLNSGAASTMDVKNENGQTAAELAKDEGDKEIINFLENPQKAKEFLQKVAKPPTSCTSMPKLGKGGSVEADSPIVNGSHQVSLLGQQGLQLPPNAIPVQLIANQVTISQQYSTIVNGGIAAVGPGSQVVNGLDPTAVARPQPLPERDLVRGESHYDVNVTGGNASIGDHAMINVGTGSARTPSTAGSSDVPFSFPQPEENGDTSPGSATGAFPYGESSGFPTENLSSFGATESLPHPVPEQSPMEKANTLLPRPVQEESPPKQENASLPQSVQEESPSEKASSSLASPVQETSPTGKGNPSLSHPVQEESQSEKANTSLASPVQEESPSEKANTSLASPVQEESPTGKGNPSLPHPVQEESLTAKANTSLPYSVSEENPTQKPDGEAGPSRSSTGERTAESIGPGAVENRATRTVGLVRNDNAEGAIAPSDAVGASGDSRTLSNTEAFNKTGAFSAKSSDGTSFKPGAALGQSWQENLGRRPPERPGPVSRSVPKEGQDLLWKEVSNSPSREMSGLDQLRTEFESLKLSGEVESEHGKRQWTDVVTKGKNAGNSDLVLHRASLAKSSGPSLLCKIPDKPKSDAQPNTCVSVSQTTASSNVGAYNNFSLDGTAYGLNSSSMYARSSSSSKESPHRKERPSREDAIPDGTLPAGTVSDRNESMRFARNGEALSPSNQARDERSPDLRNSLSSEMQSSAGGYSTSNQPVDANPEDDLEGKKRCDNECNLM